MFHHLEVLYVAVQLVLVFTKWDLTFSSGALLHLIFR